MWFLREQAKFNLENEERKRVLSFLDIRVTISIYP